MAESDVKTETNARRELREQADQSLVDYLQQVQGDSSIRVTVVREKPKTWRGRNIEGTLETFDEPISEEEIREQFGGGKYKLRIQTPNAKGSYTYAAHRTIKIAGDPKIDHLAAEPAEGVGSPNVVRETLRLSERLVDRAHQRADKAEERASVQPQMDPSVELLVRGMQEELRELRRGADAKDARIHDLMARQKERGPTDVLLEKMIEGDSARVTAIRAQHEAELRTTRERHLAEVDRIMARSDDQAKHQATIHGREIDNLTRAFEGRIEALKLAHRSMSEGLKREVSHLERELGSAKAELGELRAKKNKTVVETVSELAAVREALGSFSGGEDTTTLDRVLSALMSSPIVSRIGDRLAPPPSAPLIATPAAQRLPAAAPPPRRPQQPAPKPPGLEMLEAAFAQGTPPEAFAETARKIVGPDVAEQLAVAGPDVLLKQIAAVHSQSPLVATQRGKNWLRAVARALAADAPTPEASS